MDPALLGIALALPRIIGAIADTIVGTRSDNSHSTLGRLLCSGYFPLPVIALKRPVRFWMNEKVRFIRQMPRVTPTRVYRLIQRKLPKTIH